MFRPIAISLSPNTQKDDVKLSLKLLFSPWTWEDTNIVNDLETRFSKYFGKGYKVASLNSGRSSLYLILKALDVSKGDEVVVQAFTCVAVPNSVIWTGAKPVFVDIDDTYNIDITDLGKKISNKTKAIVVQHTFGVPAKIDKAKALAKEKGIIVIEDCAHSLGAKYKKAKVGTLGDISFFSFGRDKVISSVFGGMIVTKNQKLYAKVKSLQKNLPYPNVFWTIQQLLHPIVFVFIVPLYRYYIGKIILVFLQKLKILSKAVYKKEKIAKRPKIFPAKLPNPLASLALNQFKKHKKFNNKRKEIAKYYFDSLDSKIYKLPKHSKGAIWLRFPVQTDDPDRLIDQFKRKGILLGDWYRDLVTPVKDFELINYNKGSCPNAENLAKSVVNLPTYPLLKKYQLKYLVNKLNKWQNLD